MLIIPAIDIRGGSCVRLTRGDPNQQVVYGSDPVEMAKTWAGKGAERLHVVDLDGAFGGRPKHLAIVGKIKKELPGCAVQFGGGLRDAEAVQQALDAGADKLILGTAALEGRDWVKSALARHADRLIVGLDANGEKVAKHGWTEDSALTMAEALARMEALGFRETIYTDIGRDGMLEGPNFESTAKVVGQTRMRVYASGGVSALADVKRLRRIPGLAGAIVGKALYAGNVTLEECLAATR